MVKIIVVVAIVHLQVRNFLFHIHVFVIVGDGAVLVGLLLAFIRRRAGICQIPDGALDPLLALRPASLPPAKVAVAGADGYPLA